MSTNYKAIINGKNLYDQLVDSDTKRCEKGKKLATGQDADYTTEYVLDYDCINYLKIFDYDLSEKKN